MSASGDVDLAAPVFRSSDVEAILLTSVAGAERLASGDTRGVRIVAVGERTSTMRQAIDALVAETGARSILAEVGPTLFGKMVAERVIDELFLTVAPVLAGRSAERPGLGLVDGTAFSPADAPRGELVSARRSNDLLLVRYAFARGSGATL
jgi:riboflavin biosynthesis pyrimidine reductase